MNSRQQNLPKTSKNIPCTWGFNTINTFHIWNHSAPRLVLHLDAVGGIHQAIVVHGRKLPRRQQIHVAVDLTGWNPGWGWFKTTSSNFQNDFSLWTIFFGRAWNRQLGTEQRCNILRYKNLLHCPSRVSRPSRSPSLCWGSHRLPLLRSLDLKPNVLTQEGLEDLQSRFIDQIYRCRVSSRILGLDGFNTAARSCHLLLASTAT